MLSSSDDPALHQEIQSSMGCATFPIAAIMQVAPGPDPGLRMESETWDTPVDHHGYVDLYGNRCERLEIPAGSSRISLTS